MKKTILTLLTCLMMSILVFSGCAQPLSSSPSTMNNVIIMGDVISDSEYIYFSNAFKSYTELNNSNIGDIQNEALYRIKLKDGKIETNEETSLPENVELVVSKIVGSECSFLYSIGKYIYFASPNVHKDIDAEFKFELTTYFRVQTDGTGLSEIYTSKNQISKQSILNIENKTYLVFKDGKSLIKIELGEGVKSTAITLASDINDSVFAKKYNTSKDRFAYYTTDISERQKSFGRSGTYLFRVDIVSGESLHINSDCCIDKTITFLSVTDGCLYFKMNKENSMNYYYAYEAGNFSTRIEISAPIDSYEITQFFALRSENNKTYYIYSISTDNVKKVYSMRKGNKDFSQKNLLIDGEVKILFTSGDYVYYASENENKGIYRISVVDKEVQMISNLENFKITNISFDGLYLYFYAQNESNTTGTYYMHRADVRKAELGLPCDVELLGVLDKEDLPNDEVEEEDLST